VPKNYFISPMQHHTIEPMHHYKSEDYTSQKLQKNDIYKTGKRNIT